MAITQHDRRGINHLERQQQWTCGRHGASLRARSMGLPSRVWLAVSAIAFAGALASPVRAAGDDPGNAPRLKYTRGPDACLTEDDFRNEVAIFFGGVDRFVAEGSDVLRVSFEQLTPDRYRGTMQLTGAGGDKAPEVQEYSNCEVLGHWVAFGAHVALKRHMKRAEPAAPEGAELPPAVPPSAPPPPPLPPQRFPPPSQPALCPLLEFLRRMDLTIGLTGLVLMSAGLTDNVAPGFGLGVNVRGEYLSLGLELRGVLPSKAVAREQLLPEKPTSTPVEFDVAQISALLVPCVHFEKYFAACGVVQGAVVTFQTTQGLSPFPNLALGPRFAVEVPFAERFAAFGFAEALFAPHQAQIKFSNPPRDPTVPGVVWNQSIVSGFFGAGVAVRFQ